MNIYDILTNLLIKFEYELNVQKLWSKFKQQFYFDFETEREINVKFEN